MKISKSRLRSLLEPHGYVFRDKLAQDISLVQDKGPGPLFRWVFVEMAGKRSEVAGARAAVAVTRFVRMKGLIEDAFVSDVAENKEVGWTELSWRIQLIVDDLL